MAVEKFVIHPNYNPTTITNDMALVVLKRAVKFSRTILPTCLAKPHDVLLADALCIEIGWGNTIGKWQNKRKQSVNKTQPSDKLNFVLRTNSVSV